MMRLKTVHEVIWRIQAPVDANGCCDLLDGLEALAADPRTERTAAKFVYIWNQIPREGPYRLNAEMYHRVDEKNEIYEFVARNHRILCFLGDGQIIICSHVFLKKSRRTPPAEKRRAIAIRNEYLAAKRAGQEIELVE